MIPISISRYVMQQHVSLHQPYVLNDMLNYISLDL